MNRSCFVCPLEGHRRSGNELCFRKLSQNMPILERLGYKVIATFAFFCWGWLHLIFSFSFTLPNLHLASIKWSVLEDLTKSCLGVSYEQQTHLLSPCPTVPFNPKHPTPINSPSQSFHVTHQHVPCPPSEKESPAAGPLLLGAAATGFRDKGSLLLLLMGHLLLSLSRLLSFVLLGARLLYWCRCPRGGAVQLPLNDFCFWKTNEQQRHVWMSHVEELGRWFYKAWL